MFWKSLLPSDCQNDQTVLNAKKMPLSDYAILHNFLFLKNLCANYELFYPTLISVNLCSKYIIFLLW